MFKKFFKETKKINTGGLDIESLNKAKKKTTSNLEENSQKALKLYNKALENIQVFSAIGKEEALKEAALLLEESLKYNKTSDSYFWMAFICKMFAKNEACLNYLNASQSLDPNNNNVINFKKQFKL